MANPARETYGIPDDYEEKVSVLNQKRKRLGEYITAISEKVEGINLNRFELFAKSGSLKLHLSDSQALLRPYVDSHILDGHEEWLIEREKVNDFKESLNFLEEGLVDSIMSHPWYGLNADLQDFDIQNILDKIPIIQYFS